MSTGYTQLYPVDIWCGHMVWTTYGVGALRHADIVWKGGTGVPVPRTRPIDETYRCLLLN